MKTIYSNFKQPFLTFLIALMFLINACNPEKKTGGPTVDVSAGQTWYMQAQMDLGASIKMIDDKNGFAISRGRGDVPGRLYKYDGKQWTAIYSFPYSDFPLIIPIDTSTVWSVNHLTHNGDYQPIFNVVTSNKVKNISLPKVMWDNQDYSMWQAIDLLEDGTAWMVGQLGNILYYDGREWQEYKSPLKDLPRSSMFSVDLNALKMINADLGWAVGKNGIILKYENKSWKLFKSPTKNNLKNVNFNSQKKGWIVGEKGTILRFDEGRWQRVKTKYRDNFTAVKFDNKGQPWVCGENSRLINFDGNGWREPGAFKDYKDYFQDLEIVYNKAGEQLIWLMGHTGIYTNAHSSQLSFSEITQSASLKTQGTTAIINDQDNDGNLDLFVVNEGPNHYFRNNGHTQFADVSLSAGLLSEVDYHNAMIADINNDGTADLFEISDSETYRLLLGTSGFDFTPFSGLKIMQDSLADFISNRTVSLVDLDNDGNLDLYMSNYTDQDFIFAGQGTGNFTDITKAVALAKLSELRPFGTVFSDLNADGLVDIIIPYRDKAQNGRYLDCFLNEGAFKFKRFDSPCFFSLEYSIYIKAALAEDLNNDGFTDLLLFNQDRHPILLQNSGDATFFKVAEMGGLKIKLRHKEEVGGIINAADLNNDGWMDLVVGGRVFLNKQNMLFDEITEKAGIHFIGTPSLADIDNDGDMDIFFGSSEYGLGKGKRAALYKNNLDNKHFVKFKLKGDISNRMAIGARIYLFALDTNQDTVYVSQKQTGLGASPGTVARLNETHFGLNPDFSYSAKIIFPSGQTHHFTDLKMGTTYVVNESGLFGHYFYLVKKDIMRTWQLLRFENLLGVVLFFLLLAVVLFIFKRFGIIESFKNPVFFILPFSFFIISYHFLILSSILVINIIPSLVGLLAAVSFLLTRNYIIKNRQTRYISHYKILGKIGEGGMGRVFKALDIQSKQRVALKVLREELLESADNKKRFDSECQILETLEHPNIVRVFEVSESGYQGYIAMELLEGGTLRRYIRENHPLSEKSVANFLLQICSGLAVIHKKEIIHRDLKTNNIMLDSDGNIRIMDFGLSKAPIVSTMTNLGTAMGTLAYVAPEQITGLQIDKRSDYFSLGVIIYELLSNTLAFNAENEMGLIHAIFNYQPKPILELRPDINPIWGELVENCLKKDFEDRPKDIGFIIDKINKIVDNL